MDTIIEESGRIASLAVFRELYDSKRDIYGVISCFLTEIIVSEAKHNFTLHEITCLLNETFNFNIPEGVIKTSLGRLNEFLKKENGEYSADLSKAKSPSILNKKDEISISNNLILNRVIDYISKKKNEEITQNEKEKITHSFCSFLLDKSNHQEYSDYISAFIIDNQNDPNFINQLQCIKEGVVLYTGIMFNENINNMGSWDTELTIFLDLEILFDFAGFNGELFKLLFKEFHSFVKEINQKAAKPLIKLRYFSKAEDDIHDYFKKAEYILEGNDVVDPGRSAMNAIINGCKSGSDILEKKSSFFNLLSTNNILVDDYDEYYEEKNHKYNIIDGKIIESVAKSIGVDDISKNIELLNFVSIRRKDACNNGFDRIGYILLSGNNLTLQVAWHNEIRPSGKVPLATSLYFLTDKFWFKLNKGFGTNSFPKVFDVITKAQILLSSQLNKAVGKKFEELQVKFKNGSLTKDQVALAVIDLRKQAKKPEDVKNDELPYILDSISESSIDKVFQEQELFRISAKKHQEENVNLKEKLTDQQKINQEHLSKNIELKEVLLLEKKSRFVILDNLKNKFDRQVNLYILIMYKLMPIVIVVMTYVVTLLVIINYGWSAIEPWTYIIGSLPSLIILIFFICKERPFDFMSWLNNKKDSYRDKVYKKNNYDEKIHKEILDEIEKLENEMSELRKN